MNFCLSKLSKVVVDAGDIPLDFIENIYEPRIAVAQVPIFPEYSQAFSKSVS